MARGHEAQEQMLGADVIMVEALGFILRQAQHLARPLRKLLEQVAIVHGHVPRFASCPWNDGRAATGRTRPARWQGAPRERQSLLCAQCTTSLPTPVLQVRSALLSASRVWR